MSVRADSRVDSSVAGTDAVPFRRVIAEPALVLESSTSRGSVAIVRNGRVAAAVSFAARDSVTGVGTEGNAPAVSECLRQAGISATDLASVTCGAGPGGFTSLRSAAAIAKGICSALAIPLFAVSSLELLAWSACLASGNYIAAIAAGRQEWFASSVRVTADGARRVAPAALLGEAAVRDLLDADSARLMGPGLDIDVFPEAAAALEWVVQGGVPTPASLDSWEPDYGRLAEAQVRWEAAHGRPLPA